MDKAKATKKAVIALLIFAFVAFAAWVAFFLVFNLGESNYLLIHLAQVLRMFNPMGLDFKNYLPLSIAVLSISGLSLVFLIVMLVVSISKRRALMVLPFFMLLLSNVALIEFVANFARFTFAQPIIQSGYLHYMMDSGIEISKKIMVFAIAACVALAVILSLTAYVFAMVNSIKYGKSRKTQVDASLEETNVQVEEIPESAEGFLEEPEVEKEEPVPVLAKDNEPATEFEPEPEPEPEPEVEEKPVDEKSELLSLIREMIREEIRDSQPQPQPQTQSSPNTNTNNNTVTGANFNGPLVVQYFNGLTPVTATPAAEPAPAPVKEEPKPEPKPEPEPVVEEPAPEPVVEEAPVEEPVLEAEPAPVTEEPAPVVEEPALEPVVEEAPVVEKPKIIRIPFEERMVAADQEMKDNYNELKNEILSYGVKSRVSNSGDTFRLHRKTYVKLTIAGKSLKLYFALNPEDYKDSTIPVQDASEKNIYAEIPLVFKVKSGLSMRRAKQLIADVMAQDNLEQGEVEKINWAKEIEVALKEGKKASAEDDD